MRNCLLLAAAVMVCVACGSFQSGGGSVAPPPPAGGQGDTGSPSGGGGSDIARSDVNGGKAYFAQSAYSSFDGCIVRANPNGAGATCIDRGKHSYIDVKVDDTQVYFIRDGDVWRLPRQ